jgi:glycerophosphoryl diester phosphodiesterase
MFEAVQVPTLEEYLDIVLAADRVVGIYPETKHPTWHNSLDIMKGTTFEDLALEVLTKYGYSGDIRSENWMRQPVFIQSFEVRFHPTSCVLRGLCDNVIHCFAGSCHRLLVASQCLPTTLSCF